MMIDLLKKEFLIEFRSKEILSSMILFGISVVLMYSLAFNQSPEIFGKFAPGFVWITSLFIAVLGLYRSYTLEKEFDAYGLLLSSPVKRSNIFISKWVSGFIFITLAQVVIFPVFFLFTGLGFPSNWMVWMGTIILVNTGISAQGSFIAGLVMRVRVGEVLLPVLFFPLVCPQLIAAVKMTSAIMNNLDFSFWIIWLQISITFAVVFGTAGILIFEYFVEE